MLAKVMTAIFKTNKMNSLFLRIADFDISVDLGGKLKSLPPNYNPFVVGEPANVIATVVFADEEIDIESYKKIGEFEDLGYKQEIFECEGRGYVFRIYDCEGALAATLNSDSKFENSKIYVSGKTGATATFGINNALMIVFAFSSAYHNTLTMHSSVIKRNEWGYMFLGKSGTGKSTHSSLWLKHIDGSQLLNDDNPVLRVVDNQVFVYGSPWSGKTPCYKQDKAKVGGIVMLSQKPYNKISKQNVASALSSLMCSTSIMIWDKPSYKKLIGTMSSVISLVGLHHLECLPDKEAAKLSYNTIGRD